MKYLHLCVLALTTSLAACASRSAHDEEPTTDLRTHHAAQLPIDAGEGENKQVTVWIDEGPLRLATIALRDGTELPPHEAPVPVTIHVLEGEGTIHLGAEALSVERGSVVLLPANLEHDVVPAAGSDMLLVVHYMRR